jgi:hypothetical protein
MARYMLSAHSAPSVDGEHHEPMTEENVRLIVGQVRNLEQEMKSTGTWVLGGRLHEPDTATVVRVSNGEVLTTDGPFVESKEHLGGFYIIEANDLDSAVSWAAKVTQIVGAPIEVRPLWDEDGG